LRCRRATFCSPLSLASPVQWRLSRRYGARGEMVEARPPSHSHQLFDFMGQAPQPDGSRREIFWHPFSLPPSTFRANSNHCSATARTLNPIAASSVMLAMVSHILPPLHWADTQSYIMPIHFTMRGRDWVIGLGISCGNRGAGRLAIDWQLPLAEKFGYIGAVISLI
jgi:hypothetical protein